jgi:hypothetical protein
MKLRLPDGILLRNSDDVSFSHTFFCILLVIHIGSCNPLVLNKLHRRSYIVKEMLSK